MTDTRLVYFALDATKDQQWVKIGVASSIRDRMQALRSQTVTGQTPIVLAVEAGGEAREAELHELFRRDRVRGEWFNYSVGLQQYIAGLDHPVVFLLNHPELIDAARGTMMRIPDLALWEPDRGIEF